MGNVVIVTGMSGVKPKLVLEKLNQYATTGDPLIEIIDFENCLVKAARKDDVYERSPELKAALQGDEPIIAVASLPRRILRRLWLDAQKEIASTVERAAKDQKDVAILLHAVYFKPDSTEFIPFVDAEHLTQFEPSCVVHLIDDVYDVYAWLSAPAQVSDSLRLTGNSYRQIQNGIRNLRNVLIWRQAEAGSSAHLASLMGVPLWTVATKHPLGVLRKILKGNPHAAYVSHPISEPRRQAARGNRKCFEECSSEVSRLADLLSVGLTPWEPTTIDELRIMTVKFRNWKDSESKLEDMYVPRLSQRWPHRPEREILWPVLLPAPRREQIAPRELKKAWQERGNH